MAIPWPPGLARLGTVHFRHGSKNPKLVGFLPDGKRLLFYEGMGTDTDLRVYDVETGKVLQTFPVQAERLWKVALSPDAKLLAAVVEPLKWNWEPTRHQSEY